MRRGALVRFGAIVAMSALAVATAGAAAGASAPAAKAKVPACAGSTKKKAVAAIKKTWDIFLNGTVGRTLDQRKVVVQGAEDPALFQIFNDTFAANAAVAMTTTTTVDSVKCEGKKKAAVKYTLVLAGAPQTGLAPPGEAVIDGGRWKVSKGTVCDLVSLANPAVLESGPCATG